MEAIILEKFVPTDGKLFLPSVVHDIEYERQVLLDILLHKDQKLRVGQELVYKKIRSVIKKKLRDEPVKTEVPLEDRLSVRKVRYFCDKIL